MLYRCNCNVVDSPSFAVMVDQCIQFGQRNPGLKYKVPNRRRISGPLRFIQHTKNTAASVPPIMDRANRKEVASAAHDNKLKMFMWGID
jgi:hypothetical protein